MSRARNIKPGFFKNDLLAECAPLGRLLFAGLWCEADRAGRLEDRPKRLKAEYLPYDDCDVEALLDDLQSHGFIVRYLHGNQRFIAVLNFAKHQNPHIREPASSIPAPGEHSASTVLDEKCIGSAGLIADSPSLIPDSKELPPTAGADAPAEPDPIWGTGLRFLIRKGVPEPQARKFLGKLKREAGDIDAAALLAHAETDDITEPIPWLSAGAVAARNRKPGGSHATSSHGSRLSTSERVARINAEAERRNRGDDDAIDGEYRLAG